MEVNLEIKNIPGDNDFDSSDPPATRRTVADADQGDRLPARPADRPELLPAEPRRDRGRSLLRRGADTSFLTLASLNDGGPGDRRLPGLRVRLAASGRSTRAYVANAHSLGLQVVPYTLDRRERGQGGDATRRRRGDHRRPAAGAARRQGGRSAGADDAAAADAQRVLAHAAREPSGHPDRELPSRRQRSRACSRSSSSRTWRTSPPTRAFRTKIECMIREYVDAADGGRPPERRRPDRGRRADDAWRPAAAGAATREIVRRRAARRPAARTRRRLRRHRRDQRARPPATRSRWRPTRPAFGDLPGSRPPFVAGTDTFARGWMQIFSDMARRYDVYILGSNNQARVPRVGRPERDRGLRRPRPAAPEQRLRRHRRPRSTTRSSCGGRETSPARARAAAQRRHPQPKVPLTSIEEGARA